MSTPAQNVAAACDPQVVAEFLRALAHPMRLAILCRLLEGELSVSGFESELGLRQPNLSQQLGLLREAGLVATRREAKSVFYSLADERVRIILDALHVAFGRPGVPRDEARVPDAPRMPSVRPTSSGETTPKAGAPAPTECGFFAVAGWPTP